MTHDVPLDEAKAILRGQQSAEMWKLGAAAHVVLEYAEGMEKIARDYLASHPYPGRDEFERGSIVSMQIVLGRPLGGAA